MLSNCSFSPSIHFLQNLLRTMRLHFEQLRLATMLEHKTMETQLRGLYKILNKLKERETKLNERDEALKMKVATRLSNKWEPRVEEANATTNTQLLALRKESQSKMKNVEQVIIDRLETDYGMLCV